MTTQKEYATVFDGKDLIYYCYNKKIITIEEFLKVQNKAVLYAVKKQYHLFKRLEFGNGYIRISLN